MILNFDKKQFIYYDEIEENDDFIFKKNQFAKIQYNVIYKKINYDN